MKKKPLSDKVLDLLIITFSFPSTNIGYLALENHMQSFNERQENCQRIGFACSCELCHDEEINNDDETYEKFQRLKIEAQNNYGISDEPTLKKKSDLIEKAISGHKQMYNLAKKKKAEPLFMYEILGELFGYATVGYELAIHHKNYDKKELLKQECEKLSEIGYKIANMCFGLEGHQTKTWKEAKQNFEAWFEKHPVKRI